MKPPSSLNGSEVRSAEVTITYCHYHGIQCGGNTRKRVQQDAEHIAIVSLVSSQNETSSSKLPDQT